MSYIIYFGLIFEWGEDEKRQFIFQRNGYQNFSHAPDAEKRLSVLKSLERKIVQLQGVVVVVCKRNFR